MSRIGRKPIPVPDGVQITVAPEEVRVAGPKGELAERIHRDITVDQEDGVLTVSRPTDRGEHRALHGLSRSLIANMVEGVTNGYVKTLELQGVGYRATLKGRDLELALGYSHPVSIAAPDGIDFEVPSHAHRGPRDLQAARRRGGRQHPQEASAGALQGQGRPLPGRARRPKGREASMTARHCSPDVSVFFRRNRSR
jgi:large subunit ribosomal protein L6